MGDLYFDQQNGVSGDMAVSALLDLEDNFDILRKRLALLKLDGFEIDRIHERRNGIPGVRFRVIVDKKERVSRNFEDIDALITKSGLNSSEKDLAIGIFKKIAAAESRIHGVSPEKVHFHEVGAVDSIVDIVGFSILFIKRNVKNCHASPFHLGSGQVASMHGKLPVPAPATLEIIKGLPVSGTDKRYELTTPTGAAILSTVVKRFGPLPLCTIQKTGTGFGLRSGDGINALRVYEISEDKPACPYGTPYGAQTVAIIETTIDDSTPEEIAFVQEKLLKEGALDVFITPVIMKKSRPGFNITVISGPSEVSSFNSILFRHSSTFGIRYHYANRDILEREIKKINTDFGEISVKLGYLNDRLIRISPEYEDCAAAARKHHTTLKSVYDRVMETAYRQFDETSKI